MKTRKKFSRKRRNTILVIVLALPLFAGDIALIMRGTTPLAEIGLPFVLTFAVFIALYSIIRHKGGEKIEYDERSLRIEGRAFAYSWYLSFYAVTLLLLNDNLGLLKISSGQVLFLIIAVMLITFFINKYFLGRRGDLED